MTYYQKLFSFGITGKYDITITIITIKNFVQKWSCIFFELGTQLKIPSDIKPPLPKSTSAFLLTRALRLTPSCNNTQCTKLHLKNILSINYFLKGPQFFKVLKMKLLFKEICTSHYLNKLPRLLINIFKATSFEKMCYLHSWIISKKALFCENAAMCTLVWPCPWCAK